MSWSKGASIVLKMWPIIKEHTDDSEFDKNFKRDLMAVFFKYDLDAYDIHGVDEDLDKTVRIYYGEE